MKAFGNIAKDGQVRVVASGAIADGNPVIVNANGTVTKVQIVSSDISAATGSTATFESARCDYMDATYDTVRDRIFIAYRDRANSNYGTAVVGTVTGTSISFGTPVVFNSANSSYMRTGFSTQDLDGNSHNKCIIVYRDEGNSGYGNAIAGTIAADDSVTFTSEKQWSNSEGVEELDFAIDTSDSAFGVITYKSSSDTQGNAQVLGVSSSSLNSYTHSAFNAQETKSSSITYDASLNKFIIAYSDGASSDRGEVIIATRSSTSLSYDGRDTFDTGTSGVQASSIRVTGDGSGTIVIGYQRNATSNRPFIIAATCSGTAFSFGTRASYNSEGSSLINTVDYNPDTGKYTYAFGTDSGPGKYIIVTVSGTTLSASSVVEFENGNVQDGQQVGIAYTEGGQQVFCFADAQTAGKAFILQGAFTQNTPNITSENFIGFSDGKSESISEALGSATVFNTANSENIASAYDSTNNKVVAFYKASSALNAIVGTVSNGSISFGSSTEFNAGSGEYISAGFDSSNGKLVVAYKKTSDNYLYSKVGTVSGTSISFGSEAAVDTTGYSGGSTVTFDSTNNKIVVAYTVGSNGYAKVGTISGTSISYGSRVTFESATSSEPDSVFDTDNGKVVIAYKDQGNSNYGTAVIGTVSGTSISFGTPVVFESAVTKPSINYVGSSKVFIGSQIGGGTGTRDGKGIVGTVSGTSISFGSAVVFESDDVRYVSSVYHSAADKVIVFYQDNGNSDYGSYVIGTISGTSVSFTSSAVFESAKVSFVSSVYDSNDERAVAFYRDEGNSTYGTSITYRPSFTKSTTVLDGVSTSIKTANSISRSQSGLTAGQTYFVQNDGTLSETAADPSVTAGTAISATELIVKG